MKLQASICLSLTWRSSFETMRTPCVPYAGCQWRGLATKSLSLEPGDADTLRRRLWTCVGGQTGDKEKGRFECQRPVRRDQGELNWTDIVGLVVTFAEDARLRSPGIASVECSEPLAFLRAVAALRAALAVDLAL
jgi:hypothetical protein